MRNDAFYNTLKIVNFLLVLPDLTAAVDVIDDTVLLQRLRGDRLLFWLHPCIAHIMENT